MFEPSKILAASLVIFGGYQLTVQPIQYLGSKRSYFRMNFFLLMI